jgi:hypothetical protein
MIPFRETIEELQQSLIVLKSQRDQLKELRKNADKIKDIKLFVNNNKQFFSQVELKNVCHTDFSDEVIKKIHQEIKSVGRKINILEDPLGYEMSKILLKEVQTKGYLKTVNEWYVKNDITRYLSKFDYQLKGTSIRRKIRDIYVEIKEQEIRKTLTKNRNKLIKKYSFAKLFYQDSLLSDIQLKYIFNFFKKRKPKEFIIFLDSLKDDYGTFYKSCSESRIYSITFFKRELLFKRGLESTHDIVHYGVKEKIYSIDEGKKILLMSEVNKFRQMFGY